MGNESIKLITADNYNSISFQLQKIKNPLKKLKIKTRNRSISNLNQLNENSCNPSRADKYALTWHIYP